MGAIETIQFGSDDDATCTILSDEAGWNQTAADWDMMLRIGWAPGLRAADGTPLASALAMAMEGDIGWISMVLVTASKRRQGIAQHLVGLCIAWLEERGLVPVLDATPAGQPLYASMGFTPILGIKRLAGNGDAPSDGSMPNGLPDRLRDVTIDDIPWIAGFERVTFGAGREAVLRNLLSRPGAVALADGENGFVLSRQGCNATQIGPIVAHDEASALMMLQGALARITGPVLIDALDAQPAIAALLEIRGFKVERTFMRMAKGLTRPFGDPSKQFAIAGPELG